MAKREKKMKLQQSLSSFKQGCALVRAAASRPDLERGIELLSAAISSQPSASKCVRGVGIEGGGRQPGGGDSFRVPLNSSAVAGALVAARAWCHDTTATC